MRRRSFHRGRRGRSRKSKANWLSLLNFAGALAGQDRQTFVLSAPVASGTQTLIVPILTQAGVQIAVGGQIGKTKRIVGDVMVSAIVTAGNANADLFIREAIMYAEVDPAGAVIVPDLFDPVWQGSEDILQHRSQYLGTVTTIAGVVKPNEHKQWFNDSLYSRWDTTTTRLIDESHLLMYVMSIKPPGPAATVTMGGQLRGIVSK